MKIGLYIHIPFCQQKCLYCDFPSHANLSHLYESYVAALCQEISGLGGVLSKDVIDTIFIGGGTPTILTAELLGQLLKQIQTSLILDTEVEFSIEANPGTVDREKLLVLQAGGVNRISFGVQTFSDSLLSSIGRIHSAAQAREAVVMAQEVGFTNINVDLMYGLPGQTVLELRHSIEQAIQLNVTHISAYGLKVEEGTPFAILEEQGKLFLPEEDDDEAMYLLTTQLLPQQGFYRYEISNYGKAGYECRHNLKYWQYAPYVGVGAAAHSFWQGERLANTADVPLYIERMESGQLPVETRQVPESTVAMAEYVFLALRTVEGLWLEKFNQCFKADFFHYYDEVVSSLVEKGLIIATQERIYLTEIGMKYGNVVFRAFLLD
jgi:oxygen-independent coproporphyrinogen-3 oxidase